MPKILVVDDEEQIRRILAEFLAKMGFELIQASGGEEAIGLLRSGVEIDLMVIDMKMPKIGGIDVINEMVRINKKIPVIILTGSVDAEKYLEDLNRLGYIREDILYKPIDLFELLEKMKKKLGIKNG
jgi:CheY-like chemotaxis protein